jgi:hypothetical protein
MKELITELTKLLVIIIFVLGANAAIFAVGVYIAISIWKWMM